MPSPNSPALQELNRLDTSSPDFHNQLYDLLYGKDCKQCVPNLQDDDLVWLVDYLDKCLRELRSICGTREILPTSYTISPHLLNISSNPFVQGGFGDVYQGTLDGSEVCIKRVRVYTQDGPQKVTKTFYREAAIWKRLTHPNILHLLGITITPLQLVSNWMSVVWRLSVKYLSGRTSVSQENYGWSFEWWMPVHKRRHHQRSPSMSRSWCCCGRGEGYEFRRRDDTGNLGHVGDLEPENLTSRRVAELEQGLHRVDPCNSVCAPQNITQKQENGWAFAGRILGLVPSNGGNRERGMLGGYDLMLPML
ncbi:hypothetical protein BDM02DRAFT_3263623 [Thelephora ganbajun]|uniref:Uncharacterized protein n=1 Tax=Thelephora ganbajun TaxID=370292 RepID=A0ACB6Z4L6_THEGA|nr:hypothetical protein BDM02DRAFT_3263623 [Thelephora ganbajun]